MTEEGVEFARLSFCRTAGQILNKSVEHHVREAQHESDVAEASEYKDHIKADIKKWAFQVRLHAAQSVGSKQSRALWLLSGPKSMLNVWSVRQCAPSSARH